MPSSPAHLVGRFFASLFPRPISADERAWVSSVLTPAELAVWSRLGVADQVEAVTTARRALEAFDAPDAPAVAVTDGDVTDWIAAGLLHDVGKIDARFGPVRRALATIAGRVGGRHLAARWAHRTHGQRRRAGFYLRHAELGSQRLEIAGARPQAVVWARVHHEQNEWRTAGIPHRIGVLLARADGERVVDD